MLALKRSLFNREYILINALKALVLIILYVEAQSQNQSQSYFTTGGILPISLS
jgi:hypothetical protein